MHFNAHIALSTPSLLLTPYSPHHVPTYHTWMQSPSLRAATASEPLSLEEEYAMQESWRRDADKLTFIVCLPLPHSDDAGEDRGAVVRGGVDDAGARMIGDVNLFIFEDAEDDEDETEGTTVADGPGEPRNLIGEIELMIAHPQHRGRGLGRATLVTFISYVLSNWPAIAKEYSNIRQGTSLSSATDPPSAPLKYLRVRINQRNERSLALFRSVGFEMHGARANYFGEIELRWSGGMEEVSRMKGWEEARELRYEVVSE